MAPHSASLASPVRIPASVDARLAPAMRVPVLGSEHDLRRLARVEDPIRLLGLVELHAVTDDLLRVQPPRGDQVQQRPHVHLHVAPSGAERERLEPHPEVGEITLHRAGNADHGDGPAAAHTVNRRIDGGQESHALDAGIGADAPGRLLDRLHRVGLPGIDRNPAQLLRDLQPGFDHVDDKRPRRSEDLRAHRRHQAHRSGAYDRDDVARLDLRALGPEKARGEYVADEDRLLILHSLRDQLHGVVGVGDDDVLGLTTTQSAEVLTVAERAFVDALVEPALAAQSAVPARGEEAGDDPVARLEAIDLAPDLFHDPDELMAEHRAGVHGSVAVENVEVGAADRSERHLHKRVARPVDGWLGNLHDLNVALAPEGERLHWFVTGTCSTLPVASA